MYGTKQQKSNNVLPIVLLVGPSALIASTIVLYPLINFIKVLLSPEAIDGNQPLIYSIINVVLFMAGAVGVLGFLPCLVIGIVLLFNQSGKK